MAIRFYRAVFIHDGDDFSVIFPEFLGCVTRGDTLQDAAANAEEALSLHIEGMLAEQLEVPPAVDVDAPLPDWVAEDLAPENPPYRILLVRAELPGKAVRINVSITEDVLSSLDRAAARLGTSRSGYLAYAVRETVRRERNAA